MGFLMSKPSSKVVRHL